MRTALKLNPNRHTSPAPRLSSYRVAALSPMVALQSEVARLNRLVAAQKTELESLRRAATTCALTGALNRQGCAENLARALAAQARHGHTCAVVYLDLDGFKQVNDTHGHAAGDAVLRHVVKLLQASVRAGDSVARLGGDELAVILTHTTPVGAARKAAQLAKLIASSQCPWGVRRLHVGASVGVANSTEAATPHALLNLADTRMYAAKRARKKGR